MPGGCHVGCLTTAGREDALLLGKSLRQRYVDELGFLTGRYTPEEVYVRSTNITRTLESARMVATGIFGSEGLAVRVVTTADDAETLYPNTKLCPRLRELFQAAAK